jgi:hypothetical protein
VSRDPGASDARHEDPAPSPATRRQALPPAAYRIVDVTPSFWKYWQRHEASTVEERVRRFRREVIAAHPDLFAPSVVGRDPTKGDDLDERLPPYLAAIDERIETMRRLSARLASDLTRYDATFRRAFPRMRWSGTVYFTLSIDAFDGAVRQVGAEEALLFGIDKIAAIHGADANLSALFHHELFHMHHQTHCPSPDYQGPGPFGLRDPLWREGLAVHVAKLLNPEAGWSALLLHDEMVARADADLARIAAELQRLATEASESDYRDFFLGSGARHDLPKRVGYYLGYRIAAEVAKTRPLDAMVSLCGKDLEAAVNAALATLARTGP